MGRRKETIEKDIGTPEEHDALRWSTNSVRPGKSMGDCLDSEQLHQVFRIEFVHRQEKAYFTDEINSKADQHGHVLTLQPRWNKNDPEGVKQVQDAIQASKLVLHLCFDEDKTLLSKDEELLLAKGGNNLDFSEQGQVIEFRINIKEWKGRNESIAKSLTGKNGKKVVIRAGFSDYRESGSNNCLVGNHWYSEPFHIRTHRKLTKSSLNIVHEQRKELAEYLVKFQGNIHARLENYQKTEAFNLPMHDLLKRDMKEDFQYVEAKLKLLDEKPCGADYTTMSVEELTKEELTKKCASLEQKLVSLEQKLVSLEQENKQLRPGKRSNESDSVQGQPKRACLLQPVKVESQFLEGEIVKVEHRFLEEEEEIELDDEMEEEVEDHRTIEGSPAAESADDDFDLLDKPFEDEHRAFVSASSLDLSESRSSSINSLLFVL